MLVAPYNRSWITFNGNNKLYDKLSIPNTIEAKGKATIKTTDALNTKISSASPETEGYVIKDIIDTPEFNPVIGNDILFNGKGKNWILP